MTGGLWRVRVENSIREIVFGAEDSLVSTLGAITGIAAGTGDSYVVILSGIVLIFVEALSMAAGSYLSSKSAHEVWQARSREDHARVLQSSVDDGEQLAQLLKRKGLSPKEVRSVSEIFDREREQWAHEFSRGEARLTPHVATDPVTSGLVMGAFYLVGGLFPLAPYWFLPVATAMAPSIILTGLMLFVLGFLKAKIAKVHPLKSSLEMCMVSLSAALLGFLLGRLISFSFGVAV